MKLELTIPERVAWMPVVPVADLFALILAFVVISPAFLMQSGVLVELPETNRALERFSNPLVISVVKRGSQQDLYLGREKIEEEKLEFRLNEILEDGVFFEGDPVILRCDKDISIEIERKLIDIVQGLGFKCALAAKPVK